MGMVSVVMVSVPGVVDVDENHHDGAHHYPLSSDNQA
jgi:hypothetical protein